MSQKTIQISSFLLNFKYSRIYSMSKIKYSFKVKQYISDTI